MNVIRKHTNDFTLSAGYDLANRTAKYDNVGPRQQILWLYIISGELTIKYIKSEYEGEYNLFEGTLADLNPIEGLTTEWISGPKGCSWIAFIPADNHSTFEFDTKTIEGPFDFSESPVDRFVIPLDNNIVYNNIVIDSMSYLKIPAGKSCTIQPELIKSVVAIVKKIDE